MSFTGANISEKQTYYNQQPGQKYIHISWLLSTMILGQHM